MKIIRSHLRSRIFPFKRPEEENQKKKKSLVLEF